jgi:hypothetical protein
MMDTLLVTAIAVPAIVVAILTIREHRRFERLRGRILPR